MSQNSFDPARFDLCNASAELRAGVAQLEAMRIPMLDHVLTPEEARAIRKAGIIPGMPPIPPPQRQPVVRTIEGPAGRLDLRCFQPVSRRPRATMLHIHGGGWFTGSADMMDIAHEMRADALGIAVASVEYRLAPEHPYPAAPDDCEAAAVWLAKNARAELGADLALIGGESAGAHLSAVTLVRMRDRHGFSFAGANLVYGAYDLSGVPSHSQFDGRRLLLDGPSVAIAIAMFVPVEAQRRNPRRIAALRESRRPLPGALHGRHARSAARPHAVHVRGVGHAGQRGRDPDLPGRPARLRHDPLCGTATGARNHDVVHGGLPRPRRLARIIHEFA